MCIELHFFSKQQIKMSQIQLRKASKETCIKMRFSLTRISLHVVLYSFLLILTEIVAHPLESNLKLTKHYTRDEEKEVSVTTEARGLVHSFYYISRLIYYVPLYYQMYFCLYFLYLIWRSLYLHKVRLFA